MTSTRGRGAPARRGDAATDQLLYAAAVRLFAARGYHGTSLREIVAEVGVQIAAFYYHFGSKERLLLQIMERALTDLTDEVTAAVASEDTPPARLAAAIRAHIHFHTHRPLEAFIADSEMRALESSNRERIVSLRDRYERIFDDILRGGIRTGEFLVDDVRLTTYAVVSLCTAVASWYRPGGRLGVNRIGELYARLVLEGLLERGGT